MEELIFGSRQHIEAWQECARALVIFPYGLLLIRLIGRRVFGKWSALDIVVSVIVGSALGRAMTGGARLWATLAAVALLMVLHWALAHLAARYRIFSMIVEGESIRLAQDGKLDRRKMRANNITAADLNEALRGKSLEEPSATKLVAVEPSGKISVLPKQQ
jgi:uncharacterized membrane protein YcaP (DUF421 family)